MAPALAQMTDLWWLAYGEECICGVAGDACAQLHRAVEEDVRDRLMTSSADEVPS